jgi:hypothetical protein
MTQQQPNSPLTKAEEAEIIRQVATEYEAAWRAAEIQPPPSEPVLPSQVVAAWQKLDQSLAEAKALAESRLAEIQAMLKQQK